MTANMMEDFKYFDSHCIDRVRERYGLNITAEDIKGWEDLIYFDMVPCVATNVYRLNYQGQTLYGVATFHKLRTFITEEQVRERQRSDGARKKVNKNTHKPVRWSLLK